MRLTSELFVAQLVRRVFSDGGFAAVARKGASEAGAIFVLARARSGGSTLYGPAPQSFAARDDEDADAHGRAGGRAFLKEPVRDEAETEARLTREARFDPDFWVVEIETETPERYLDVVEG